MKRRINYSVMGEKAILLKQQISDLIDARNQLLNDVDTIKEGYKGKDSDIIVEKYKEKINNVDTYIKNIENLQTILEWLSENYKDSHNKAKSNIEMYSPLTPINQATPIIPITPTDGIENNNILSTVINMDDIIKG